MKSLRLLRRLVTMIVIILGLFLNWHVVSDYCAIVAAAVLTYLLCELY